jgi:drug/metabolite transporter (DMT)-like permease
VSVPTPSTSTVAGPTAGGPAGSGAKPSDRSALTVLAVVVTILAWASAFVAIRGVGHDISPGALALGRLLIGTAVLGWLASRRSWVRPSRREWGLLLICGIGWFGIYNVALNAAEQHLDAGTTSMLVNIGPILIAVFAGLVLGEGFPRWLVVGIAVAFAGVVLIGLGTRGAETDLLGVVLCLVAALTYAIGVVAQKLVLGRLPAPQVTFTACAIGALACLPWAGALVADVGSAPAGSILGMVYLGAVPTALAFSTWAYALVRMDAGKLGVTTYLVPPLVILLGWLLLDEVPPVLAVVGGAVCLAGVALSRRHGTVRPVTPAVRNAGPRT